MNIHPSYVVKKQNGLYVGKTSNDVKSVFEAKIYPTEKLAQNSCYATEQVETVSVPGDKIVIHRLYPTRWFQFDGELSGWAFRESEATLFASKEAAIACASEHNHDFKNHPERFCLETYERMTKEEVWEWAKGIDLDVTVLAADADSFEELGTPENPIVNTYEYRGIQDIPTSQVSGSLWFPVVNLGYSSSLASASIDYSVTREDMLAAVAKRHNEFSGLKEVNPESEKLVDDLLKRNQKPYERKPIPSPDILKSIWVYQDAIKRFESWSSVVSARKFAPEEHPYVQFAQAIVDRDKAHKELVDLLRNEK